MINLSAFPLALLHMSARSSTVGIEDGISNISALGLYPFQMGSGLLFRCAMSCEQILLEVDSDANCPVGG